MKIISLTATPGCFADWDGCRPLVPAGVSNICCDPDWGTGDEKPASRAAEQLFLPVRQIHLEGALRMTRACLHIGLSKTGTSSIQKWLETHAAHLRAQGVICVPLRRNPRYKGNLHAEFCACLSHQLGELCPSWSVRHTLGIKSFDDQARIATAFVASLEAAVKDLPCDSLFVLSSEHVTRCINTPRKAQVLREFLTRYFEDIEIVVYIRRQEDFIRSEWSQLAKLNPLQSLQAFINKNPVRDYSARVHPFETAFGPDRITVRLAVPDTLSGKPPLCDFQEFLKIDPGNDPVEMHENKSPSAAALELLRSFTRTNPSHFKNGYMNPRYRAFLEAISANDKGYTPLTLTQAQADHIRQVNLPGNTAIRDSYFPERADLFPQKYDYPETIDIQPEIISLASEVAEHLLNRPVRLPGYRACRDLYETLRHSGKTASGQ